jgi:NnrS protein
MALSRAGNVILTAEGDALVRAGRKPSALCLRWDLAALDGRPKGRDRRAAAVRVPTTAANDVVRPIHSKAMPVLLTTAEEKHSLPARSTKRLRSKSRCRTMHCGLSRRVRKTTLNLVRLERWRSDVTLAEPLLAVLHLAPLCLAPRCQARPSRRRPRIHALTAGAIGTMVIAVITRGNGGRSRDDADLWSMPLPRSHM